MLCRLLARLRCPHCRAALQVERLVPEPRLAGECAVLRCPCSRYPVLDGIPLLTRERVSVREHVTGTVQVKGPSPRALIDLIGAGRPLEALLRLLAFPPAGPAPVRRLFGNPLLRGLGSAWRRWALGGAFDRAYADWSAEEWLDFFFRRSPIWGDYFNYSFFRYGLPRHLGQLSLLSLLPAANRPLLDLACGVGHLGHYLTACSTGHAVIGFDRNFFQLWLAGHRIAPAADFVCGDAEGRFPFHDAAFSGIVCSDAFHLLRAKGDVVAECRRCAPDGPIMLARTGNRLVPPNEAEELAPDEYAALFEPARTWILGERELVARYRQRRRPDLSSPRPPGAVRHEKSLYVITGPAPLLARDHGRFDDWPHAVGRLGLNPIYAVSTLPGRALRLDFRFPSTWHAGENRGMETYHPPRVVLPPEILEAVNRNARSPAIDRLIGEFVVVGLPDRYRRTPEAAVDAGTPPSATPAGLAVAGRVAS